RRLVVEHLGAGVVGVGPHAYAGQDLVTEPLGDLGLVDGLVGRGDGPAGARRVLPRDEPGRPRELDHPGGGQSAGGLHLEARAGAAVGADLAGAHDHHHVLEVLRDPPHSGRSSADTVGSDGSAAIVPTASSATVSVGVPGRPAASAAISRSAVPSPPVRSTETGAAAAACLTTGAHLRRSAPSITV